MKTNLILTLSRFFLILTCLMCICYVSKKSLCYDETKKENYDDRFHHLSRTTYFLETDESNNFENPELPYSYGPNHFQLGGFCMQWGYTTGSDIKFHFPFDRCLNVQATVSRVTSKKRNIVVRWFSRTACHIQDKGIHASAYWLAIGVKIGPTNAL